MPLFDPDEPGHTDRLHAVLGDCKPSAILTAASSAAGVRAVVPRRFPPPSVRASSPSTRFPTPSAKPGFARTSSSTTSPTCSTPRVRPEFRPAWRSPTALSAPTRCRWSTAIELTENSRGVTWLPLFHDMGLLTVILPALGGKYITIMSPRAFVQRPVPVDQGTRRGLRRRRHLRRRAQLRLRARCRARAAQGRRDPGPVSNVIGLINGSEPVTRRR